MDDMFIYDLFVCILVLIFAALHLPSDVMVLEDGFDFEMRQADLLGNKVVKDRCFTEVSSAGQLPTQARLLLLQDLLEIKALRRKNISEYLGMETMLAVVCKTYSGVKALETYEKDGSIVTGLGLHGLGASIGRPLGGRFLVICLEQLR
ncbi:unnamed protein product [Ilex paraguariensis]|uniref:Uncharacterized protein n=1 Tax=Ilex paraguariensis TaxID=185542 RepID=A0ABC8T9E2_9AQUA